MNYAEHMIIRYLYILFLGILLSLLVGVGIAAFYPSPQPPTVTQIVSNPVMPQEYNSAAYIKQQKQQQMAYDTYDKESKQYNRNVSIISLVSAIGFVVISFLLIPRAPILSDGVLLSGLFTLIYSIIRGFGSNDSKFRFIVVAIAVLIVLFLGFRKFIQPSDQSGVKVKKEKSVKRRTKR